MGTGCPFRYLYLTLDVYTKHHQAIFFKYIFLTVHIRIILAGNKLDAQFLLQYVYMNALHVSSNSVLILRRTIS